MGHAYRRVAVGSDGSSSSLQAVDRAASIAADADAELLIICVYRPDDRADTTTSASRPGAVLTPDAEQADHALDDDSAYKVIGSTPAEDILDDARQRTQQRAAGGRPRVETVAVPGHQPAGRIVDTAAAHHADLVVVGNQGLNSLRGRLLGSVPQDVSRHAISDVLIVHTLG